MIRNLSFLMTNLVKLLIFVHYLGSGKKFTELKSNKRASAYISNVSNYRIIEDYETPDEHTATPKSTYVLRKINIIVAEVFYESEANTGFCWSTFNLWNDILGGSIVSK